MRKDRRTAVRRSRGDKAKVGKGPGGERIDIWRVFVLLLNTTPQNSILKEVKLYLGILCISSIMISKFFKSAASFNASRKKKAR